MRSQSLTYLQGPTSNTVRAQAMERRRETERKEKVGWQDPGAG